MIARHAANAPRAKKVERFDVRRRQIVVKER